MELNLENATPMRWPAGPLEIARRERTGAFSPRIRKALEHWHQPAALEILNQTPVDTLVVSWAAGLPADAEQWRSAVPFIEAARRRNTAVVGWVDGAADPHQAAAAANNAGLSAVAMRGFQGRADLPVIAWSEREDVPWDSQSPAVAVAGNVWPGVNISQGGGDAGAGPTSLPWLDSNGWYIQLARVRLRTPLWLVFDPPGKEAVFSAQSYANAIADSEIGGGRWVISLDDDLRVSLAEGAATAIQSWRQIAAAARFFRDHAEWKSYRSLGLVGLISDFSGSNFATSGEVLNLMARRDLLFRVIWKSQIAATFDGLKALVYPDTAAPDATLRRRMMEFVEQGGLLITGPEWGVQGKPAPPDFPTQLDVRAVGKGRLAVARQGFSDPYQVAMETQFLLSHRYDLVKIYNAPSSGCTRFTAPAGSRKALVQCVSYADGGRGGSGLRTVWVRERFGKAQLWSVGGDPIFIDAGKSEEYIGVEYRLPASAPRSYVALELEA